MPINTPTALDALRVELPREIERVAVLCQLYSICVDRIDGALRRARSAIAYGDETAMLAAFHELLELKEGSDWKK